MEGRQFKVEAKGTADIFTLALLGSSCCLLFQGIHLSNIGNCTRGPECPRRQLRIENLVRSGINTIRAIQLAVL